jgi:hypothetical protein
MKKVSTAAAKQIRNFSEQKLTVGLDLGDRPIARMRIDAFASVRRITRRSRL